MFNTNEVILKLEKILEDNIFSYKDAEFFLYVIDFYSISDERFRNVWNNEGDSFPDNSNERNNAETLIEKLQKFGLSSVGEVDLSNKLVNKENLRNNIILLLDILTK